MKKTILVDDLEDISHEESISGIVYERICYAFCFIRSSHDDEGLVEVPIERFWNQVINPVMDDCRGDDFLLNPDEEYEGTDEEKEEEIETVEEEFMILLEALQNACKEKGVTHIKINERFSNYLYEDEDYQEPTSSIL